MPISGPTPFTINFTDTSSGMVTAWAWNFGDGTTSTAQNPTHTYWTAGTYTVRLRITTARGTAEAADTVTVSTGAVGSYTAPSTLYMGTPGTDPQVMLKLSNDGGKTWVAEMWRSAGKVGEYYRRVRWERLGAARRRVFEVTVTDPVPWRVTGAYLQTLNSSPQRQGQ